MDQRVHYSECPVCGSPDVNPLFSARDHTVSGQEFVIWQCGACTLRFTQDVPTAEAIGPYYKAESYISHTDTSKGLVNRLYQRVRRYTLQQKVRLIESSSGIRRGTVLDVGCGTGAFLRTMKEAGWAVQGLEPDPDARRLASDSGVPVQPAEVLYELPQGSFDVITLWHVLEHVHELHRYIEQLKSLLKPGGRLFIAVPNYTALDADIYRLYWAAYDVPRHLYHFSPKSLETLLGRHGLRLLEKRPMWFDSFYISLLSSRYQKGSTAWIGAPLAGLRSNLKALGNKDRCSSITYVIGK
ncbi:class I SAM-dependent methyltransferase [Flaviaesturariibacter amylovorans]|uniref:Methyltransferase domain-containing protein n=1 Tax=Flaviaesturariibacter amylovorans TaxID=1084520 RepID=A0ABP8GZD4_9BACT